MENKLFMKRENRDKEYRRLKDEGLLVSRGSHRGQLLHPMYVEDYPRQLSSEEKGFGNTLYKTYFSVLYEVTVHGSTRPWR